MGAYKRQSERPRFPSRFCSFEGGRASPSLPFFYTRAVVEFQRGASFRNPRQRRGRFRRHKDIPTTIKKSLDSVALLHAPLKRKTLRLPFSARCRIIGSRYRARSRSFARGAGLTAGFPSIAVSAIQLGKLEEPSERGNIEIRM